MVTVRPHATRLDLAARTVGGGRVPRPHPGAQAVEGVVGDGHGVVEVGEARDGDDGTEDLLLEDAHLVVALEDRRGHVVAAGQVAAEVRALATGDDPGALLRADVDVGQDLLELVVAGLRPDHGRGVERVALHDGLDPLGGGGEERLVDRLLDERTRRAGAHLALVEREHREALEGLVVESVLAAGHVGEEDVGALAAELEGDRDEVLAGVLGDEPARGGLPGEGDLADPGGGRERLARLHAEAVDHVEHAGGQQVGDELDEQHDRGRGLLGGLEHHGVAGGQRGRELPDGHQDGEVPRDDLRDHAEGLVEVVSHGVLVDLGQAPLLRPDAAGEVAEVVHGQRQVGSQGLTHGLAVVPGLADGEHLQVRLHAVGDLVQDVRAISRGGLAPRGRGSLGGVQRQLDVLGGTTGDLAEHLARDRRRVLEVLALDGWDPLAADPVLVARLVGHGAVGGPGGCVHGHVRLHQRWWANRCR